MLFIWVIATLVVGFLVSKLLSCGTLDDVWFVLRIELRSGDAMGTSNLESLAHIISFKPSLCMINWLLKASSVFCLVWSFWGDSNESIFSILPLWSVKREIIVSSACQFLDSEFRNMFKISSSIVCFTMNDGRPEAPFNKSLCVSRCIDKSFILFISIELFILPVDDSVASLANFSNNDVMVLMFSFSLACNLSILSLALMIKLKMLIAYQWAI